MGGGFGGSTINLMPESEVEEFTKYASQFYKKKYGYLPGFLQVKPSNGASFSAGYFDTM